MKLLFIAAVLLFNLPQAQAWSLNPCDDVTVDFTGLTSKEAEAAAVEPLQKLKRQADLWLEYMQIAPTNRAKSKAMNYWASCYVRANEINNETTKILLKEGEALLKKIREESPIVPSK